MGFCIGASAFSAEVPESFVYQGRLLNAAGTSALTSVVDLRFQIFNPSANCLLYEELQTNINLSLTGGMFAANIGSSLGSGKRTTNDPGLTMAKIFANTTQSVRLSDSSTTNTCPAGYTANAGDSRLLRVTVIDGASVTTLSPDQVIGSQPYAIVAQTLQGVGLNGLVQLNGAANLTQATLEQLVSGNDASTLHHHDSLYVRSAGTSNINMGSGGLYTTGRIGVGTSSPATDIEIERTNPTIRLEATTSGGGSSQIQFYSGNTERARIESPENSSVLRFYTGGVAALTIDGNQNASFTGNLKANGFFDLGDYDTAAEGTLNTYLTGCAANCKGTMWFNTDLNQIRYWNGTAIASVGDGIAQYLKVDGSSTMAGALNMGNQNITNVAGIGASSLTATTGGFGSVTSTSAVLGNITLSAGLISNLSSPVAASDAANKSYVDAAIGSISTAASGAYLRLDGSSTMTGPLNLASQNISNVGALTASSVTSTTGGFGTITSTTGVFGNLTLSGGLITNLSAPVAGSDAANKSYVDAAMGAISTSASGAYLKLDGTSAMSGDLNLATYNITSVGTFTSNTLTSSSGGFGNITSTTATFGAVTSASGVIGGVTLSSAKVSSTSALFGGVSIESGLVRNLASPTDASDAATKSYVDSLVGAVSTAAGGSYVKLDGTSTLTGNWNVGGWSIGNVNQLGIGTNAPGVKLDVIGSIRIGDGNETCAGGNYIGALRYNGGLQFCNGASWQTLGVAGSGLTNFNGETGSAQALAIGTAGTIPNWSSNSNIHTLHIPLASNANVEAGLISKADYDTFSNKADGADYLRRDGTSTMTGPLNMGGQNIENAGAISGSTITATSGTVGDVTMASGTLSSVSLVAGGVTIAGGLIQNLSAPVASGDAANKSYVDAAIGSISTAASGSYLKLDGSSTMAGNLDLGTFDIESVGVISANTITASNVIGTNGGFGAVTATSATLGQVTMTGGQVSAGTALIGGVTVASGLVRNLASPIAGSDAANKNYVDNLVGAISTSASNTYVKVDGTSPLTANWNVGGHTISNLNLQLASGAVSLPSLSFVGDSDTGIFSPGANTLALGTAGSRHLTLTSTGYLGLGTETPQTKFHIKNNAAGILLEDTSVADNELLIVNYNNYFEIQNRTSAGVMTAIPFTLDSRAPGQSFYMNSSGLLALGHASPSARLHVNGSIIVGNGGEACSGGSHIGAIRYNSGLQFCNGSAWQTLGVSGSGLTNFAGQTGNTQTLSIEVGSAGTIPSWNSASNNHALRFPNAATAGVVAGLLSKADYDTFAAKANAADYVRKDGGSTMTGALHVGNNAIDGIDNLQIADPGPREGLIFNNTAADWVIDVTPLNRANSDGNMNLHGTSGNIALWRPTLFLYDASNYTTLTPLSDGGVSFTPTGTGNILLGGVTITNGRQIKNLAAPTAVNDAVTKAYVDSAVSSAGTGDFKRDGTVTMTGGLPAFAGTASLPGYSFGGDLDTGFWHPGANTLAISTGGNTRMTFDSTGKVGINTTQPASVLEVVETNSGIPRGVIQSQYSTNDSAAVWAGRKARGTPASPLAVANNDYLTSLVALPHDGSNFLITGFAGFKVNGTVATNSIPTDYVIHTGSNTVYASETERVRVTSTGNVGIGTASPTQKLSVAGKIQSYSEYFATLTIADGWVANDYWEVVRSFPGLAGGSSHWEVAFGGTRNGWAASAVYEASSTHNAPNVWREMPEVAQSPYEGGTRCFTVDINGNTHTPKFRIRAIKASTLCGVAGNPLYAELRIASKAENLGWERLSATGSGATVTGFQPNSFRWNLYTGDPRYGEGKLAMHVDENGRVGIGTKTPTAPLEIRDTNQFITLKMQPNAGAYGYQIAGQGTLGGWAREYSFSHDNSKIASMGIYANDGTTGYLYFEANQGGLNTAHNAPDMVITNAGRVGIGKVNPAVNLHVEGQIAATGWVGAGCEAGCETGGGYAIMYANGSAVSTLGWTTTSDIRLKEEIEFLQNPLNKILRMESVSYYLKDRKVNDKREIGLIAQKVQEVFPEVVHTNHNGYMSVDYARLVSPLIGAIQEQQKLIEKNTDLCEMTEAQASLLEARIKNLERSDEKQNRRISSLEEKLEKATEENKLLKAYLCPKDPQAPFCH